MKTQLFQLIVTLLISISAIAAPSGQTSLFDRLESQEMIEVKLTVDLEQLMQMKKSNDYLPATFSHGGQNWDLKVKTRGRFRRKVCDFPPLKLKFKKDGLVKEGLAKHNEFKLVTHCSDDWNSRDYVAREQLAYEIYGTLTETSLRTQLVKITYQDSESKRKSTRYGILIEDIDEMAERVGAVELDNVYNLPASSFQNNSLERVAMFQYMIGNADWDSKMTRNIKIIQYANGQHSAVPYDFDFAAIVSAPYVRPNPEVGQFKITDRVLRHKFTNASFNKMSQEFLAKKNEIVDVVAHYPHLSKKSKSEVLDYINAFYLELDNGTALAAVGR